MAEKRDTEGPLPHDIASLVNLNDTEETHESVPLNGAKAGSSKSFDFPSSWAANFFYVVGFLCLLAGGLTFLESLGAYSGRISFEALTLGVSGGLLLCFGRVIQYIFDIRNLLEARFGHDHA